MSNRFGLDMLGLWDVMEGFEIERTEIWLCINERGIFQYAWNLDELDLEILD